MLLSWWKQGLRGLIGDSSLLQDILSLDLDFHDEPSTYSSHGLHAFAARFPPQLPGVFIDRLTKPGDVVLDPMNGSGTTTLEAYLRGRRAIGCDIDPLAVRIARVKATPVHIDLRALAGSLMKNARRILEDDAQLSGNALDDRFDREDPAVHRLLVFPGDAARADGLAPGHGRLSVRALRSGSCWKSSFPASSSRRAAASPARVTSPTPGRTSTGTEGAKRRYQGLRAAAGEVRPGHCCAARPRRPVPISCNAAHESSRLEDESVHLIVTSPPYANAIDYMRANKFSLVWLGTPVADLGRLPQQVHRERDHRRFCSGLLPPSTEDLLHSLNVLDRRKEAVLRKYYLEMRDVVGEMRRVLMPGHYAIVVVGTSTMRGLDVRTPLLPCGHCGA